MRTARWAPTLLSKRSRKNGNYTIFTVQLYGKEEKGNFGGWTNERKGKQGMKEMEPGTSSFTAKGAEGEEIGRAHV